MQAQGLDIPSTRVTEGVQACGPIVKVLKLVAKHEGGAAGVLAVPGSTSVLTALLHTAPDVPATWKVLKRAFRVVWLLHGDLLPSVPQRERHQLPRADAASYPNNSSNNSGIYDASVDAHRGAFPERAAAEIGPAELIMPSGADGQVGLRRVSSNNQAIAAGGGGTCDSEGHPSWRGRGTGMAAPRGYGSSSWPSACCLAAC